MSEWGPTTYGDPCRACGFGWAITKADAVDVVSRTPAALARLLGGVDGSSRHADLRWPVVAYVCHVSDNLRIWAERIAGLALGDPRPVARYDPDLLAQARRYDEIALVGALWSLGRAVDDWKDAVALADHTGITLHHPDRGEQSLLDVVRSNAHDAYHHRWDIDRTVGATHRLSS